MKAPVGKNNRLRHPAKKAASKTAPKKIEGAVILGVPLTPDKVAELIRNLGDAHRDRFFYAAVDIIERYRTVAGFVAVHPEINMGDVNAKLNKVVEANLAEMIRLFSQKNPPLGLNFLANSVVITSPHVKEAAKRALEEHGTK